LSATPNGQAALQYPQPLQTSDWMSVEPNSVRTIAPVGQASRQEAWAQCLQTSLIISQLKSPRLLCTPSSGTGRWKPGILERLVVWVVRPVPLGPRRVGLMTVEAVALCALDRLVVHGQRAVAQAGRCEQPCLAVALGDERVRSNESLNRGRCVLRDLVVGRCGEREVRTSSPVQRPVSASHQTSFFRSLHGAPSGRAEQRL
jgi:hypothetical protein